MLYTGRPKLRVFVRTTVRIALLIAQLSISGHNLATAQRAEALRLEFRPGSHLAVVKGNLQGRQQMEYVTELRNGQLVTLTLVTKSRRDLKLRLRNPGNQDVALLDAGAHRWTATLGESGDYEIWVVRLNNSPGKSSYTLRVTIR